MLGLVFERARLPSKANMTRVKKTRSMKRIHSVKTGSISKLKRAAGNDRQVGKRVKGRRVLSAYEKFLLDNPEASEAAKAEQKLIEQQALERKAAAEAKAKQEASKEERPARDKEKLDRSKTLFDQLDSKLSRDIY